MVCSGLGRLCERMFCSCRKQTPLHHDQLVPLEKFDPETESLMNRDTTQLHQLLAGVRMAAQAREPIDTTTKHGMPLPNKHYNLANPSSEDQCILGMKDYAPGIFRSIRQMMGVTTEEYLSAWNYAPSKIPQPAAGAGRSGSMFLLSSDGKFLIKTIPRHEVDTLKEILVHYADYLRTHPSSRLIRFYGLHRFRAVNDFFYLVVCNNIFHSPKGLSTDEKFDLKGRKPKPSSLKKGDIAVPASGGIWKDKQLTRHFYPDNRQALIKCLIDDAKFLRDQDCIDYSLLMGIHNVLPGEEKLLDETNDGESRHHESSHSGAVEVGAVEVGEGKGPPAAKHGHGRPRMERSYSFSVVDPEVGLGIPSTRKNVKEVYFIGVIDFLSRYKTAKKCANFWKNFLWNDKELSTVPPPYYYNRFVEYIPTVIVDRPASGRPSEDRTPRTNDETDEKAGLVADHDGVAVHVST